VDLRFPSEVEIELELKLHRRMKKKWLRLMVFVEDVIEELELKRLELEEERSLKIGSREMR